MYLFLVSGRFITAFDFKGSVSPKPRKWSNGET